jgi:hypothetical protein
VGYKIKKNIRNHAPGSMGQEGRRAGGQEGKRAERQEVKVLKFK